VNASAEIKNGELIIRIPVEKELQASKSGKTLLVATTHGNHATTATVQGKPVVVSVNAYIKP
jgi:hypothetical protein